MTDLLTIETFTQWLNGTFTVRIDDSTSFEFTLIEVSPLPSKSVRGETIHREREPFSIIFRGPREPLLPQRIYRFDHPEMESVEIFIVPIGYDGESLLYEAVFN